MSLIDELMEECVILNKVSEPDGDGGTIDVWKESAPIMAAITNDTSTLAKIAEHDGVTSTWKITTKSNVRLQHPDVVKRIRDGATFRVTSDGNDVVSPKVLSFDVSQVSAEKWRLS